VTFGLRFAGDETREFGDTAMVKPDKAIIHTRELLGVYENWSLSFRTGLVLYQDVCESQQS